jgi:hypothetical protein
MKETLYFNSMENFKIYLHRKSGNMLMHFVVCFRICFMYQLSILHCLPPGFLFYSLFYHQVGSVDYGVIQQILLEFYWGKPVGP